MKLVERMCVGCREKDSKQSFIRIVCNKSGEVSIDSTGKMPGRGAYIHNKSSCLKTALKKNSIGRNLKCRISDETRQLLEKEINEY